MDLVIVIAGPTASGKTGTAIGLAKEINGEIISADSMQVYKYMDIGTAKPDIEEMAGIRHYLIDEVLPDEEFSVARFKELALKYIKEIKERGKIPIIAGGTGLYINSLIYNINFSDAVIDWELRELLKKEVEQKGNKYLYEKLCEIDPESAERIHENDVKRIIRAIEVYTHTKKTISYHRKISITRPPEHRFMVIGLDMDRQKLYERINKRVDRMLVCGLINEVKNLKTMGYDKYTVAMQGLGYKEILLYLNGELSLNEAKELLKRDTRRYAKRQLTWFRRIKEIHWINVEEFSSKLDLVENIKDYIASNGIFL